MAEKDYLSQKLLQREQYNILSEEDRLKIRHTLNQLSNNRGTEKKIEAEEEPKEKKDTDVPHISTLQVRNEFNWFNYPEELDEVPYLFLFRIHLFAHIKYKTVLKLKRIQELCLMSGLANFTLKDMNLTTTRLAGDIAKGGSIKSIILFLIKIDDENYFIDNCIFKAFR